jgi:hypothetical protein
VRVAAWRVQDSGLVAAPGPFRRLPGSRVRHLRGDGPEWPVRVVLDLGDDELRVTDATGEREVVGAWSRTEVRARRVTAGPPVQFVLELPGQVQLLAAAAAPATDDLLAALLG